MSTPPAPGGSTPQRRCTSDPGSRWASLPEDLARMVAFRLLAGDLLDYVRFRAVCTGWRSGTESPRGRGVSDPRFYPRRWMMLPEGHGLYPGRPELDGYVRFLNLDTGALVRARIPLLLEVDCIVDSVDGLLLLLRDADEEGGICLVHPFTGDTLELPPLRTLLPHLASLFHSGYVPDSFRRLTRVVCASISFNAGVMAIMLELFDVGRLAYATSQDQEWTLSSWVCRRRYAPLSFQGKLYMVDTPTPGSCDENIHQVFQIDPPVEDGAGTVRQVQPPKLIATIPADKLVYPDGLVQCGSEILVIGHNEFYGSEFIVCKLSDLVLQRFIPVKNIGGYSLFVYERNISVSSKILPTVKGDNLVFIHSDPPHVAQCNLSTGILSLAIDSCSLYGHVPGPSSLVHHIFSCCIYNEWSRGLIFRRKVDPNCLELELEVQILNEASHASLVFCTNMWVSSSYARICQHPLFLNPICQFLCYSKAFPSFFYVTQYSFKPILVEIYLSFVQQPCGIEPLVQTSLYNVQPQLAFSTGYTLDFVTE